MTLITSGTLVILSRTKTTFADENLPSGSAIFLTNTKSRHDFGEWLKNNTQNLFSKKKTVNLLCRENHIALREIMDYLVIIKCEMTKSH
jgi:hypothetical protein